MSATVIPITESPPLVTSPAPSPGQLLSAKERSLASFRIVLDRERVNFGVRRSADLVTGYRRGWDDALAFLRMQGVIR